MKFIGFLKEEDKNIRDGKSFEEMLLLSKTDASIREIVLLYLKGGTFLTGVMSYIYDNEQIPIGNLDYFTDGNLVWPIYYTYYLEKYDNFFTPSELIDVAIEKDILKRVYPKKH